ncbi:MAG: acetyltransferase [Zetaproteobacteria bacterium]|nr:MAG: acetyltransferase [Zetaproteobacteria bacterium]
MFLKDENGDLVHVEDLMELVDPHLDEVLVRYQAGEEQGDPVRVKKASLRFPSGEPLPKCWLDPHYRIHFD